MTCDCDQNTQKKPLMAFNDALNNMLAKATPVTEILETPLLDALDLVLAEDIFAPFDVPPHNNSAMDGYAVKSIDMDEPCTLEMVGTVLAGQNYSGDLQSGQCLRIMTGAPVPASSDAVVMQENVTASGNSIQINQVVTKGANVRKAGEDINEGALVLRQGEKLNPSDLGLLASLGFDQIKTFRKIKAAVISTGDELVAPGKERGLGQIFESNRFVIISMLKRLNVEVIDLGIVEDTEEAIRSAFEQASEQADIIVSSGGVSVGDADFVKQIIAEMGEIGFWKLAIKPGKPFAFGHLAKSYFMGLPGNPVSATVTFNQLVVPFIRKLSGAAPQSLRSIVATAENHFKKKPGRLEFQRAWGSQNDDGSWSVNATGSQGSGILSSMSAANGFVILAADGVGAEKGEQVEFQFFDSSIARL